MSKKRPTMLEMDRGSGSMGISQGASLDPDYVRERSDQRDGLRELDLMTEASERLTRAQKDRARIFPRNTAQPLNPRTDHRVPELGELRRAPSAHQMRVRSKAKHAAHRAWTTAQHREMKALISDPAQWDRINDQLSDMTGDIETLSKKDQQSIRRIDRAISRGESFNERQQVVYIAFNLPPDADEEQLASGTFTLDRYTVGTMNLADVPDESTHVLELPTRRGLYMGQSAGGTDSSYLLPRGLFFETEAVYEGTWVDNAGERGNRRIIRIKEQEES